MPVTPPPRKNTGRTAATTIDGIARRDVLKLAGAAVVAPLTAVAVRAPTRRSKKVIVAGGGIAGLSCAYELMRRGHDVTVLEASGRTGGHVFTFRHGLADGLYGDAGAEHFVEEPAYHQFWQYVREFNLPVLEYPRREGVLRYMHGKLHTVEMLADRKVLAGFGLNPQEVEYLSRNAWGNLGSLYYDRYADRFDDEYRPFAAGLDHLDEVTTTELLRKEGASEAAIRLLGSASTSALYTLWYAAILKSRGVALWPPKVFRLKGGNQTLPNTFAAKLGQRVRLGCPVTGIRQGKTGVTVTFREYGQPQTMEAEYLVSCMQLSNLRNVPITPGWSEAKAFVIRNVSLGSYCRVLFQARRPYWRKQGISPNMSIGEASLHAVWQMPETAEPTGRILLPGSASRNTTPEQSLATYRKYYPGKTDEIENAIVWDWSKDRWHSDCERNAFPLGQLARFWPAVMEPHGRIHFAGAYADNLNWGMEAATRSANRVAREIDRA